MTSEDAGAALYLERHEDDEWYDAINIYCVERWKDSEISGDEWRFTYVADFMRKGSVQKTLRAHKLAWLLPTIAAHQSFAPVGDDDDARQDFNEVCFQPGCGREATHEFRKVKDWCPSCGTSHSGHGDKGRRFCDRHKRRGDCGLDDADSNYVLVRVRAGGVWAKP